MLTGYLSLGHQPGSDWVNMQQWAKCFTIPAINCRSKCPNEPDEDRLPSTTAVAMFL